MRAALPLPGSGRTQRRWLHRIVSLGLLLPGLAQAHDFWIEPSTYRPLQGAPFEVSLRLGEPFEGRPYPRVPERTVLFELLGMEAAEPVRSPVAGAAGWEPAGIARAEQPGLHVLAYLSTPATIELPPDRFDAHLASKGLDAVLRARAARPGPRAPGRERYVRCAKSLVHVRARAPDAPGSTPPGADPVPARASQPVGLPFEIVLDVDPHDLVVGTPATAGVLFHGKPLAGVLVQAIPSSDPTALQESRSDSRGRVRLRIPSAGPWLIIASHMLPIEDDAGASWQSYWGSLSLEVPASGDLQR